MFFFPLEFMNKGIVCNMHVVKLLSQVSPHSPSRHQWVRKMCLLSWFWSSNQ